ncbi:hypothetical protein [Streptomyces sp. LN549]|uniref:hypothetical protein n=1 Tax=Streptomyces sp. LN549 TaxID=3112979 RepID=UPI00371E0B8C
MTNFDVLAARTSLVDQFTCCYDRTVPDVEFGMAYQPSRDPAHSSAGNAGPRFRSAGMTSRPTPAVSADAPQAGNVQAGTVARVAFHAIAVWAGVLAVLLANQL